MYLKKKIVFSFWNIKYKYVFKYFFFKIWYILIGINDLFKNLLIKFLLKNFFENDNFLNIWYKNLENKCDGYNFKDYLYFVFWFF